MSSQLYRSQWRLMRMELLNWGSYHGGGHTVDFNGERTTIVGMSGAGKSTLLDAHRALLGRSQARFNAASNPLTRGRARGEEERNIAKYVRGEYATDLGIGGNLVPKRMRDGDAVLGSISEVYRESEGQEITVWAAWVYRASDSESEPWRAVRAVSPGRVDMEQITALATEVPHDPLNKGRIRTALPGTEIKDSVRAFNELVWARLGLTPEAAFLLERIQDSTGVESITELFRHLVFDEPATYQAAEDVLRQYELCHEAYENLETWQRKRDRLLPIREWHDQRERARAEAARLDPLEPLAEHRASPFWWWVHREESALLDVAEEQARSDRVAAEEEVRISTNSLERWQAQLSDARARVLAAGGDRIVSLEAGIKSREVSLERVKHARSRFARETLVLGAEATSKTEHDERRAAAKQWLQGHEALRAQHQERHDRHVFETHRLKDEFQELVRECEELRTRNRGLVRREHSEERDALATALGLRPEQLPFLAELIDVPHQWESWRLAIELALGGDALRILVPESHVRDYRRVVDQTQHQTSKRFLYHVIQPDAPLVPLSEDTAGGRLLILDDHPYRGWVSTYLKHRLDHICVDDADALHRLPARTAGLTIAGQVRDADGKRGSHGGQRKHRRVIGFNPAALIFELEQTVHQRAGELTRARESLEASQRELTALDEQERAHRRVIDTLWDEIDVESERDALAALQAELADLLSGNSDLRAAQEEVDRLEADTGAMHGRVQFAKQALSRAQEAYDAIVDRKDRSLAAVDRFEASGTIPPDFEDLTSRFAEAKGRSLTLTDFEQPSLREFGRMLTAEAQRQRQEMRVLGDRLRTTFEQYSNEWSDEDRGTDPDTSYAEYDRILATLLASDLGQTQDAFIRHVSEWSGNTLIALKQAFDRAPREIRERLQPISDVLRTLSYSSLGGHLAIESSDRRSKEVKDFLAEITDVAKDSTSGLDFEAAKAKYRSMADVMARISPGAPSRDRILDVRRHIDVEAIHFLENGERFAAYNSPSQKSGGEMQEAAMFILGVALRYQQGDPELQPPYAPVLLDESMIKADPEHTERALAVWEKLGFQALVSIPVSKWEETQRSNPSRAVQVSKDRQGRSRIDLFEPVR